MNVISTSNITVMKFRFEFESLQQLPIFKVIHLQCRELELRCKCPLAVSLIGSQRIQSTITPGADRTYKVFPTKPKQT